MCMSSYADCVMLVVWSITNITRYAAGTCLPISGIFAGWGVSDTSVHWTEATGRGWSFLWSLGPTPFGPMSVTNTLSFAQRDAMLRNLALVTMNRSIVHASALIKGFGVLAGDHEHVKKHLIPDQVGADASATGTTP